MDYLAMAYEFLDVRRKLLQVPINQQLDKMERGELFVLNYLATHTDEIHPKDLSTAMSVSTARIASLLNKMEEKKLVKRYADEDDNRKVIVVLTELGQEEILRIRLEILPGVCSLLESLGEEDAENFIRIHKKIWQNYKDKVPSK